MKDNPISKAVLSCNLDNLKKLLEDEDVVKQYIDLPNQYGEYPLQEAVKHSSDHRDIVDALLDIGAANIEVRNHRGRTCLSQAVYMEDISLMRYLLEKKANVNTQDDQGRTPLSWVVSKDYSKYGPLYKDDQREIIELLLKHGADLDIVDKHKLGPISHAVPAIWPLLMPAGVLRRRLIVCCDGTWNDRETDQPLTNVARILSCLEAVDRREYGCLYQQIPLYIDGIGTGTRLSHGEGATGKGIERKIREAYRFLCSTYVHPKDQIVLIGFSRGAYTIQCLAKLINDIGLIDSESVNAEFPKIFDLWAAGDGSEPMESYTPSQDDDSVNPSEDGGGPEPLLPHGDEDSLKGHCHRLAKTGRLRHPVPINAYAAWDTVKALGTPRHPITDSNYAAWVAWAVKKPVHSVWPWKSETQESREKYMFVDEYLPSNIIKAFHAMALDERRYSFQSLGLRTKTPGQQLKQCWFLGSHGDIGGGCDDSGVANISMCWMVSHLKMCVKFSQNACWYATAAGSILRKDIKKSNEAFADSVNAYDSYTGWWRGGGSMDRVVGKLLSPSPGIRLPETETIHFTVRALSGLANPVGTNTELSTIDREWKVEPLDVKSKPLMGFKCCGREKSNRFRWIKTVDGVDTVVPEDRADDYEVMMLSRWIDRDAEFAKSVGRNLTDKTDANHNRDRPDSVPFESFLRLHPGYY